MGEPPCAGFIVFDHGRVILVRTAAGNFSFPKGKRLRGESAVDAAYRELREETGLEREDILPPESVYFDEKTRKGYLSVRYFLANSARPITAFSFDQEELADVGWYDISEAMKLDKLKQERREILRRAAELYKFHDVDD